MTVTHPCPVVVCVCVCAYFIAVTGAAMANGPLTCAEQERGSFVVLVSMRWHTLMTMMMIETRNVRWQ